MIIDDEFLNNFIFLIFVIFAVLLIIAMINKYSSHDEPVEIIHIDKEDLKTGDLIGVAYSNIAGAFISSFSNSIWSHTGVIWVDPSSNIVYILEGAHYPLKEYKGIIRIPFDIWYRYNGCFILGLKKYYGVPIDQLKMISLFEKYEGKVQLEGLNPSWGRFLMNTSYYSNKCNKTYTCFEITIRLLQDLNIYKKEKLHSSYFPGDIMCNRIPYENGNYFPVKRFFLTPTINRLIKLERSNFSKKLKK